MQASYDITMPNKLTGARPHATCPTIRPSFCQGPIFGSRLKNGAKSKMCPRAPLQFCSFFVYQPEPHFPTVNVPFSLFREERIIFNETVAATAAAAAQINGDGDKIHGPGCRHAIPPRRISGDICCLGALDRIKMCLAHDIFSARHRSTDTPGYDMTKNFY